ncbi:MAG: nucleotidyltransferase family protein [Clostridia bacterium]|nr:nucleotidyltransferase family protein [Clostridia bacterium]
MKICGIIAEYNPFHNGHKLQLESALEKSKADLCIVVMSGMFTQRGEAAIVSKFARVKMALSQGADIVVELPLYYVLQPAEYFALGGVKILHSLGADFLSYGTEAVSPEDRKTIEDFVNITNSSSRNFDKQIRSFLKSGIAYPQARALAYQKISGNATIDILKSPNAILEIAYRNAIYRLKSHIEVLPVPRAGDAYHESVPQSRIASATAIRKLILEKKDFSEYMPAESFNIIKDYLSSSEASKANDFYPYFVHTLCADSDIISALPDGSTELFNRMIKGIAISSSMDEFIDKVSTRRFTRARVSRAAMNSIFGISAEITRKIRTQLPSYARILGIRESKRSLLGELVKQSKIPLFMSPARHQMKSPLLINMLNADIAATNLYNMAMGNHHLYNQDYTEKLIIY